MRRQWLMYLLTFSLAINGATAAAFLFFWWQSRTLAAASSGQKSMRTFLQEDLNLTREQASPIFGLIDQSKRDVVDLRAQMETARGEMMSLISEPSLNRDAVAAKMSEINNIQAKMRAVAVNTVTRIIESLPRESRDRFRAYLQERGRACDMCGPRSPGGRENELRSLRKRPAASTEQVNAGKKD